MKRYSNSIDISNITLKYHFISVFTINITWKIQSDIIYIFNNLCKYLVYMLLSKNIFQSDRKCLRRPVAKCIGNKIGWETPVAKCDSYKNYFVTLFVSCKGFRNRVLCLIVSCESVRNLILCLVEGSESLQHLVCSTFA